MSNSVTEGETIGGAQPSDLQFSSEVTAIDSRLNANLWNTESFAQLQLHSEPIVCDLRVNRT